MDADAAVHQEPATLCITQDRARSQRRRTADRFGYDIACVSGGGRVLEDGQEGADGLKRLPSPATTAGRAVRAKATISTSGSEPR